MIGRTNVGGSGLLEDNAILRVVVPTGSSVTATKGGKTLTPKMWTQNADNTLDTAIFSIPSSTFDSNPWTVTATLGGSTITDTIIINDANEYDVNLVIVYIIKNGILQPGWATNLAGISSGAIVQGSGYLEHNVPRVGNSYTQLYYTPKKTFPFLKYLVYDGQQKGFWYDNPPCPAFGIATTLSTGGTDGASWAASVATRTSRNDSYATRATYILDISNVSGEYWVSSLIASSANQSVTGGERIYNLYMTNILPE